MASKVRGWAQRSTDSTTEIKKLIDESTKSVSSGSVLVTETREASKKIIDAMQEMNRDVESLGERMTAFQTGNQKQPEAKTLSEPKRRSVKQAPQGNTALKMAEPAYAAWEEF